MSNKEGGFIMTELTINKELVPLLSNVTLNKLSDKNLYNEFLFNEYAEKITYYLIKNDIESLKLLHIELNDKKEIYFNIFNKKFTVLNEMHFNLKNTIKNELVSQYNKNKDEDKDVSFYQEIEKNILENLKKAFQDNINFSEKDVNTYSILSISSYEILHEIELKNIRFK